MKPDEVNRDNEGPVNDKFLDDVIDGVLSRYSRVEARPGLEDRVLRAVREQKQESRTAWLSQWISGLGDWRWASLATAAAVLIIISVTNRSQQPPTQVAGKNPAITAPIGSQKIAPQTEGSSATNSANLTTPARSAMASTQPMRTTTAQLTGVKEPTLPRQSQFPMAAPATQQEILLAQVAAQADPAHMAALAAVAGAGIKPLDEEIKPLEIPPLSGTTAESAAPTVAPGPAPSRDK